MESLNTAPEWLKREDNAARSGRIERLKWLVAHYPAATALGVQGGWLSMRLLEEVKYCYVYGQYLATSILGVAFLERELAAQFYAEGRDDLERAKVGDLLNEALQNGWLSEAEFQRFDRIRRVRNPMVHFRRPLANESLEARAVSTDTPPDEIVETDAKEILQAVLHVLMKHAV